jgi:hypothetical protein
VKSGISNEKGAILIATYLVIVCLISFATIFADRTVSEKRFADIATDRAKAFYLAEAGVDKAIQNLRGDFNSFSPVPLEDLGEGKFEASVTYLSQTRRTVDARGYIYIPNTSNPKATRHIQAVIKKEMPPGFFGDGTNGCAILSADDVLFNGNSYSVEGDVIYAGELTSTGGDVSDHVIGTVTQDPSISPLARFNFNTLYDISVAQGNLYDQTRLDNIKKGLDTYPDCSVCPSDKPDCCFWFSPPTNPSDPSTGIPNIVFVQGNMVLNGNIGTVGGFFIVVGDVLPVPPETTDSDSTLNGNGTVEGCVYSLGEFRINGGGNTGLNINGGVWCESGAELKGTSTVQYDGFKMEAIQSFIQDPNNDSVDVQLLSWIEV